MKTFFREFLSPKEKMSETCFLNVSLVECFYYVGNLAVVLLVMYYPIAQRLLVVVIFMRYENVEIITRFRVRRPRAIDDSSGPGFNPALARSYPIG